MSFWPAGSRTGSCCARPPTIRRRSRDGGPALVSTSRTSSSSHWTPRAPTTWAATATPRRRRPTPTRWRAGAFASRRRRLGRAAHAAGTRLDHDGAAAHPPRRAGQRHHGARAVAGRHWPRSSPSGATRPAPSSAPSCSTGGGASIRASALRRPVRPAEVQAPRSRRRTAAGERGDGPALAWLEGHKQGPFFAWIHLYDAAHSLRAARAVPLEVQRSRARGPLRRRDRFRRPAGGRLVSWLRRNGLDQKTVVVVIGDHGEGLGSHGEGTHGYFVYDYAIQRAVHRRHAD